jgi:hypothetical protein
MVHSNLSRHAYEYAYALSVYSQCTYFIHYILQAQFSPSSVEF